MIVTLDLTDLESGLLTDAVNEHQDQGPTQSGWASPELITLRTKVDKAVSDAIMAKRNEDPEPFGPPN